MQAVDPVVLPERVSALPSSGRTTGSTVCIWRVPALPSAGQGTGALTLASGRPHRLPPLALDQVQPAPMTMDAPASVSALG